MDDCHKLSKRKECHDLILFVILLAADNSSQLLCLLLVIYVVVWMMSKLKRTRYTHHK